MLRTLFVQEFGKRLLRDVGLGALVALLGIAAKSATIRWLGDDATTQGAFDTFAVVAMLAVAAGTGSSVFSRAFRDGPLRLLDVLPVRRSIIWLLRVSSAAASAVMVMALLFLVQPSMLRRGEADIEFLLTGLALLLFATGCCLSTFLKTPTLVTSVITGAVSLGIVFVLLVVEHYISTEGTARMGFMAGVAMAVLFLPVCLAFSFRAYVRGELDTPRRRWQNAVTGGGVLLGTLLLFVVAADAGVFEWGSPWTVWIEGQVSHDGGYLSIIQTKAKYSPEFRLYVVDTRTGQKLKIYEGRGRLGQAWTPDGALILFRKNSALKYLLKLGSEDFVAIRVFPTEQLLLQKTHVNFGTSTADRRGPLVVLQETNLLDTLSRSVLLRMDSSGQARELLTIPTRFHPTLSEDFDGSVLSVNRRTWQIREDVKEIRWNIGRFRFTSSEEFRGASVNLANSPIPPSGPNGRTGKYFQSSRTLDFNDSIWLYYLESDPESRSGRLWARRQEDAEWTEILKDIRLSVDQMKDLSPETPGLFTRGNYPNIQVGERNGIVAYLSPTANPTGLMMLDLNTGESFDLGNAPGVPGKDSLRVFFPEIPGLPSVISVYRGNAGYSFYYHRGKGAPMRLSASLGTGSYLHVGEDGSHIYPASNAQTGFIGIYYVKPPESPRQLWP
jgi:hypothetical protein